MQDKTQKITVLVLSLLLLVAVFVLTLMLVHKKSEKVPLVQTTEDFVTDTDAKRSPSEPVEEITNVPDPMAYKIDMTPYLESVGTNGAAYLILVNKTHSYGAIIPDNIVDSKRSEAYSFSSYPINETALSALEAMCLAAEADGVFGIDITSAYRSYERQAYLFDYYTEQEMKKDPSLNQEEARRIVETYSCRAGTSEHQTGLAVDLRLRGDDRTLLEESFAQTQAGRWLADNCARFGFVLRYPADKTAITGIQFEPWHFRFVGYAAANEMQEKGMCLEEYTAYLDSLEKE